MSDLNISHEKLSDFVPLVLFEFPSVIKLINLGFESQWNALIFFDQKNMTSDLNMSHGKMSDFVSFALFGFAWVIKQIFLYVLRFFYMISDLNMSCQTVSDLV